MKTVPWGGDTEIHDGADCEALLVRQALAIYLSAGDYPMSEESRRQFAVVEFELKEDQSQRPGCPALKTVNSLSGKTGIFSQAKKRVAPELGTSGANR